MRRFPWLRRRWKWFAVALVLLVLPPVFVEVHRRQRQRLVLDVILQGGVAVTHARNVPDWAFRLLENPFARERLFHLMNRAESVVYPPGVKVEAAHVAEIADEVNRLGSIRAVRLREHESIDPGVFESLRNWRDLERLYVNGSEITDESLPAIAKLSSLRELDLDENPVTANGVRELAALRHLERLSLVDTKVYGPEALAALQPLRSLKEVRLGGFVPITDSDVRALKEKLPGVSVRIYNAGESVPEWR